MWRLLGIEGVYENQWFKLNEEHTSVGAGEKCHIRLDGDESVPRWQGEFLVQGEDCMYGDLNSEHLAVVNKTDEGGFYYLFHGDTIRIGGTLFRMEQLSKPNGYAPSPVMQKVIRDEYFKEMCRRGVRPRRKRSRVWLWILFAAILMVGSVLVAVRW
ncbi:MAG: FHA domain-containing protein [Armatimonadota bacterium]